MTAKSQWVNGVLQDYGLSRTPENLLEIGAALEDAGLIDDNGDIWDACKISEYNEAIAIHFKRQALKRKAMDTSKPEQCPYCDDGVKSYDRNYPWRCNLGGLHCYLGHKQFVYMEANYGIKAATKAKVQFEKRAAATSALSISGETTLPGQPENGRGQGDASSGSNAGSKTYWNQVMESAPLHNGDSGDGNAGGVGQDTFHPGNDTTEEGSKTMEERSKPVVKRSETFVETLKDYWKRR